MPIQQMGKLRPTHTWAGVETQAPVTTCLTTTLCVTQVTYLFPMYHLARHTVSR